MRDRIALVTAPGGYWGAEEAGISIVQLEDAASCAATVRDLVRGGQFGIVAISEAAATGDAELATVIADAPPEVSVLLLPTPGMRTVAGLAQLRDRFAVALGVDIWKMAAEKAGVDV